MFNRTEKNEINFNKYLKEIANSFLKQTHIKSNNKNHVLRVAQKVIYQVNKYLHQKLWHVIGIGTAVGLFLVKLSTNFITFR